MNICAVPKHQLRLAEIQSFVSNLEQARVFYEQTLGLSLKSSGDSWLIFDLSGLDFVLMSGARAVRPPEYGTRAMTVLCLETSDIQQTVKQLQQKGVYFLTGIKHVPQGWFAAFKDPDGNVIELVQH